MLIVGRDVVLFIRYQSRIFQCLIVPADHAQYQLIFCILFISQAIINLRYC